MCLPYSLRNDVNRAGDFFAACWLCHMDDASSTHFVMVLPVPCYKYQGYALKVTYPQALQLSQDTVFV